MAFVQSLLSDPSIPLHERLGAIERVHSDPGVPDPLLSTASFWFKYLHPQLAKARSQSLPSQADIVIIGSGITGASIARSILQQGRSRPGPSGCPRIVILEARDVCSGATGRNGGHILETVEDFADLVDAIGIEPAKKVTRLRLSHLDELIRVAEEFGLTEESQVRQVEFLSAHFSESRWEEVAKSIELFKEAMPVESQDWKIFPRDKLPKNYLLSRAAGVISGPAGALWPYKLVTGLFSRLLELYPTDLVIETNTPVKEIQYSYDNVSSARLCEVVTSLGSIHCRHVIHCTNAHVAHLVPRLRGRIYPVRGHMSVQSPDANFVSQAMNHSWLFNYEKGFDYLTQLIPGQHSTNEMMLGGGFASSEHVGIKDIGVATDDKMCSSVVQHLSAALGVVFDRGPENPQSRHQVQSVWVGNMGFSADGFPWVGLIPPSCTNRYEALSNDGKRDDQPSDQGWSGREWICAGFSGEGMVHAWRCGTALATMLLRDDGLVTDASADLSWFPEQMLISEERIMKSVLPRTTLESVACENIAPGISKGSSVLVTSTEVVTVVT